MWGMKHPAPASASARAWLIIRMTRPAFLLLTVVACVLGTATAAACGCGLDPGLALTAGVLAVLAHAAGNVINDLHDARNGADAANLQPMTPFAGGSRLIQQGLVSERQTAEVAWGLMLLVALGGLWLAVKTGGGLIPLGLAGLGLAWAYSAPPLKLMSRGLGELAVGLVWFLVVIGADYVQRRQFFLIPASAAASFALLTMAVLLINSLPDAANDAQVGKHTTAVRLGADGSCVLYVLLVLLAHGWLALSAWWLIPPVQALWGLLSLPLSLSAAVLLVRHRQDTGHLRPALVLSVAAVLVHGLGMAAGFWQVAQLH